MLSSLTPGGGLGAGADLAAPPAARPAAAGEAEAGVLAAAGKAETVTKPS